MDLNLNNPKTHVDRYNIEMKHYGDRRNKIYYLLIKGKNIKLPLKDTAFTLLLLTMFRDCLVIY